MIMTSLKRHAILPLLALASALPATSSGQGKDAGARMERVADGVYAIIHENATEEWPNSNTGVIVGEDGVLVVDATYLPSRARADIALIRTITDKPVRYLVITHLHRDHTGGAVAYRDAFPGVHVITGPETREFIAVNRPATSRATAAPESPQRKTLARLEAALANGRDSSGRPYSAATIAALTRNVAERKGELAEMSVIQTIVPDLTFNDRLELYLGSRQIELRNRGRANSPDDVTIYDTKERVMFTGDIVVQAPLPYTGATWPAEWSAVLRDIDGTPTTAIVPGHGPVMRDHSYINAMRVLIDNVRLQVAAMLNKGGMSLDQIQNAIDVGQLRSASPVWNTPDIDSEDWRVTIRALVERTWHEVRGLD